MSKKRPWFKWYPSDWRAEARLRLCSRAARSLWLDMLGLMHESTLIGYLLINGKNPTPEQLARVLGDDLQDLVPWLEELHAAGVYSETDDGVIFSRRMVRDAEMAEKGRSDIALRWGAKGKSAENTNRDPNPDPNRVPTGYPITHIPETRSQNKNTVGTGVPTGYGPGFEEFWKAYPRTPNMSKAEAWKVWVRLDKSGHLADQPKMLAAVSAYKQFLANESKGRKEPHPPAHAATWLNQRRYDGFIDAEASAHAAVAARDAAGWEAAYPKWASIRAYFRKMHGSDALWHSMFAGCSAVSETEIVVPSRFQRDRLVDQYGEKLANIIGSDVTFRVEPAAASPAQATH